MWDLSTVSVFFNNAQCSDNDLLLNLPSSGIAMASLHAVYSFLSPQTNLHRRILLNFYRPGFKSHCHSKAFPLGKGRYNGLHPTGKGVSLVGDRLSADQTFVAHLGNSGGDEETSLIRELDLSVFRFTLGIPGYDESNLPRLCGIVFGFLLASNHFWSGNSRTGAQLRSEALGIVLAAIAISLPYVGKRLKATGMMRQQNLSADCRQVFIMSENLSDIDKEDLAWGSYALLQNTSAMSVLIFCSEALCVRGCWDTSPDASKSDALTWFKSKIEQTGFSYLTSSLYFSRYADKQGWEIIPKGATSLLVEPFTCRVRMNDKSTSRGGFVLLISSIPEAFRDKDRAWVGALANKFENLECNMSK